MVVPQELTKSDIVKIIEQLDKLLPSNFTERWLILMVVTDF